MVFAPVLKKGPELGVRLLRQNDGKCHKLIAGLVLSRRCDAFPLEPEHVPGV